MTDTQKIVTVRPGQLVQVQVADVNGRATFQLYSYEEIHDLVSKPKRKSKSAETYASRHVALFCRAIKTGKWATGANVDVDVIVNSMASILEKLDDPSKLTPNAINSLQEVTSIESTWLSPTGKQKILDAIKR